MDSLLSSHSALHRLIIFSALYSHSSVFASGENDVVKATCNKNTCAGECVFWVFAYITFTSWIKLHMHWKKVQESGWTACIKNLEQIIVYRTFTVTSRLQLKHLCLHKNQCTVCASASATIWRCSHLNSLPEGKTHVAQTTGQMFWPLYGKTLSCSKRSCWPRTERLN